MENSRQMVYFIHFFLSFVIKVTNENNRFHWDIDPFHYKNGQPENDDEDLEHALMKWQDPG